MRCATAGGNSPVAGSKESPNMPFSPAYFTMSSYVARVPFRKSRTRSVNLTSGSPSGVSGRGAGATGIPGAVLLRRAHSERACSWKFGSTWSTAPLESGAPDWLVRRASTRANCSKVVALPFAISQRSRSASSGVTVIPLAATSAEPLVGTGRGAGTAPDAVCGYEGAPGAAFASSPPSEGAPGAACWSRRPSAPVKSGVAAFPDRGTL
eukprot:36177-Pyramimonas_sp.AAC.1